VIKRNHEATKARRRRFSFFFFGPLFCLSLLLF
jgi:hypothetical protein